MQLKIKKEIKNTIYKKKIKQLNSFAVVFKNMDIPNINLTRIIRTQFLKSNNKIFINKTLPANIEFLKINHLNELVKIKNNIILIKYNSNYFYPNQLESLLLNCNLAKTTSLLGFYKKFYFILKTISCKN